MDLHSAVAWQLGCITLMHTFSIQLVKTMPVSWSQLSVQLLTFPGSVQNTGIRLMHKRSSQSSTFTGTEKPRRIDCSNLSFGIYAKLCNHHAFAQCMFWIVIWAESWDDAGFRLSAQNVTWLLWVGVEKITNRLSCSRFVPEAGKDGCWDRCWENAHVCATLFIITLYHVPPGTTCDSHVIQLRPS